MEIRRRAGTRKHGTPDAGSVRSLQTGGLGIRTGSLGWLRSVWLACQACNIIALVGARRHL